MIAVRITWAQIKRGKMACSGRPEAATRGNGGRHMGRVSKWGGVQNELKTLFSPETRRMSAALQGGVGHSGAVLGKNQRLMGRWNVSARRVGPPWVTAPMVALGGRWDPT